MKTIGKIVAGILIASVLLIGGCVAIIGAGVDEAQKQSDLTAITPAEYQSIKTGTKRSTVEARLGKPQSRNEFSTEIEGLATSPSARPACTTGGKANCSGSTSSALTSTRIGWRASRASETRSDPSGCAARRSKRSCAAADGQTQARERPWGSSVTVPAASLCVGISEDGQTEVVITAAPGLYPSHSAVYVPPSRLARMRETVSGQSTLTLYAVLSDRRSRGTDV